MYIYFVYCNTEFYQSTLRIYGTYMTMKEAVTRIESFPVKHKQKGPFGDFWISKDNSLRFFIKKYPMGDCVIEQPF